MASTRAPKRPYAGSQPAITSFFSPAPHSNAAPSTGLVSSQSTPSPSFPELPATVQSNLLSVGMRVRKSVPEGYKTGSEYSAYSIFTDSTPMKAQQASDPVSSIPDTGSRIPTARKIRTSGVRELTPFCGLLKVGGMSQQWGIYEPAVAENAGEDMDELDEVPFLSSQGSTISTVSVESIAGAAANKRRYSDDDEENLAEGMDDTQNSGGLQRRVMAVPRRKKDHVALVGAGGPTSITDFEDAEFLDYSSFAEVEMRDY